MQFFMSFLMLLAVVGCSSRQTNDSQMLNKFVVQFSLNSFITTLYPVVDNLDQRLTNITLCYESKLAGNEVNIFKREATIKSIIEGYYQALPEKSITRESVGNLIRSITQIINACLRPDLDSIRYGLTSLSDLSSAELDAMKGLRLPMMDQNMTRGSNKKCKKTKYSIPANFDWRKHGAVTTVQEQGCGNCWAFAAVGSIEGAYLASRKITHQKAPGFPLSVQQITDCAIANGCNGGNAKDAYNYVISNGGITSDASYPFRGKNNQCSSKKYPNVVSISDYCYRYSVSDKEIQQALLYYGPLYIGVEANDNWYVGYTGGIVDGKKCSIPPKSNHAALLVGYTPKSWILKNSHGSSWGLNGYFEMARGGNVCGINYMIGYPLL